MYLFCFLLRLNIDSCAALLIACRCLRRIEGTIVLRSMLLVIAALDCRTLLRIFLLGLLMMLFLLLVLLFAALLPLLLMMGLLHLDFLLQLQHHHIEQLILSVSR